MPVLADVIGVEIPFDRIIQLILISNNTLVSATVTCYSAALR